MPGDQSADADTVDDIVRAVPGVADLHAGMFGEVGTYLPGRRVVGIRLGDGRIEVHLVLAPGAPVRQTGAAVRAAVSKAFPAATVDVTVEDIAWGPRRPARPVARRDSRTAQTEQGETK